MQREDYVKLTLSEKKERNIQWRCTTRDSSYRNFKICLSLEYYPFGNTNMYAHFHSILSSYYN